MDGGHLFEIVLEKKVEASTNKIIHESSGSEGVAESTGLLAEGVEKIVNDKFFGHSEGFWVAVFEALSDTEEKAQTE